MCLLVPKDRKEEVLEKDLICYKVLAFSRLLPHYYTPYTHFHVEPLRGSRIKAIGCEESYEHAFGVTISGGFIHCMGDLNGAEKLVEELKHEFGGLVDEEYVIFKCIIPKGTEVFIGKTYFDFRKYTAIAAKEIEFIEEVICV